MDRSLLVVTKGRTQLKKQKVVTNGRKYLKKNRAFSISVFMTCMIYELLLPPDINSLSIPNVFFLNLTIEPL